MAKGRNVFKTYPTMNKIELSEEDIKYKLFVGGLDPDVSSLQLGDYFSQFGKIRGVKIVGETNGKPRGFGFIVFEGKKSLVRSCAQEHELNDRKIDCKPSLTSSIPPIEKPQDDSTKIFLREIPLCLTKEKIAEYFSKYGNIGQVLITIRKKREYAFGFVVFSKLYGSKSVLDTIIEKEHLIEPRVLLKVERAIPKDEIGRAKNCQSQNSDSQKFSKTKVLPKVENANQKSPRESDSFFKSFSSQQGLNYPTRQNQMHDHEYKLSNSRNNLNDLPCIGQTTRNNGNYPEDSKFPYLPISSQASPYEWNKPSTSNSKRINDGWQRYQSVSVYADQPQFMPHQQKISHEHRTNTDKVFDRNYRPIGPNLKKNCKCSLSTRGIFIMDYLKVNFPCNHLAQPENNLRFNRLHQEAQTSLVDHNGSESKPTQFRNPLSRYLKYYSLF